MTMEIVSLKAVINSSMPSSCRGKGFLAVVSNLLLSKRRAVLS